MENTFTIASIDIDELTDAEFDRMEQEYFDTYYGLDIED